METEKGNPDAQAQPPRTSKQRRQRRKRLERANRRRKTPVTREPPADEHGNASQSQNHESEGRKGRKPKPEIQNSDLSGLKYFEKLGPRFKPLHGYGCERDKAGNRTLHYDQFCMGMLMALFNPMVDSLGGLDQAAKLGKVQQRLGVERMSVSSLSKAARLFDAEQLTSIIKDLGEELQPLGKDPRLVDVRRTLTLVDGTLLNALPKILQAVTLKEQKGSAVVKWRLHTQFEVERYVPTRIDVTPNGGGEYDERAVMERTVEANRCYVMDRGYAKFALLNKIHGAPSSYVCRLRDNSAYCAIIASMLFCLWTGRRPSKRTYEMVCYYFLGLASEEELLSHLGMLPPQELPYSTKQAA